MGSQRRTYRHLLLAFAVVGTIAVAAALPLLGRDSSSQSLASPPITTSEQPTSRSNDYTALLTPGETAASVAKYACRDYQRAIESWRALEKRRFALIIPLPMDAWDASRFVGKSSWINWNHSRRFKKTLADVSLMSLRRSVAGHVQVTDAMRVTFQRFALHTCDLSKQRKATASRLWLLDQLVDGISSLASRKPWYPQGFEEWENGIAYRFPYEGGGPEVSELLVMVRGGCPRGVYGEMNLMIGNTVLDYRSDLTGALKAGQVGLLVFEPITNSRRLTSTPLTELRCS